MGVTIKVPIYFLLIIFVINKEKSLLEIDRKIDSNANDQ